MPAYGRSRSGGHVLSLDHGPTFLRATCNLPARQLLLTRQRTLLVKGPERSEGFILTLEKRGRRVHWGKQAGRPLSWG